MGDNMKKDFKEWEALLKKEYDWLREQYPTDKIHVEKELKLFDIKKYENNNGWEISEEISASIHEWWAEGTPHFGIMMELEETVMLDQHDIDLMKKNKVNETHLYFWMLYHEYGHLVQMNETVKNKGLDALIEELNENNEEVEKIFILHEKNKISEQEADKRYRELWFEQYADNFANKIYSIKKESLK